MYSANNEAGDLEVLEIKIFFAAQPWWADFIEFLKNSFSGFYTLVMAYLKISWRKGKNSLSSSFYHHQGVQNLW